MVLTCVAFGSVSVANPAKQLAESVLSADSVTIEFYSATDKEKVTFSDPAWITKLSGVLESAYYSPRGHCLCISYPMIHLRQKGDKVGTLSVHHGVKLRAYVGSVHGDFHVGEKVGRAVLDLAMEKGKR